MRAFFLFILFPILTLAQNNGQVCIGIEKTKIAGFCVPSTREICHSGQPGNCEIMGAKTECIFVKGPNQFRAPVDDWSRGGLQCVAKEDTNCRETTEGRVCDSVCVRYKVPYCKTMCKPCYEVREIRRFPFPGCKRFCADKYCDYELGKICDPSAQVRPEDLNRNCPINQIPDPEVSGGFLVMPVVHAEKCGPANYRCEGEVMNCNNCSQIYDLIKETFEPTCNQAAFASRLAEVCDGCVAGENCRIKYSGEDPNTQENCKPELRQAPPDVSVNRCPWITMPPGPEGNVSGGRCEPVAVGNRFPQDCCTCTGGQPAGNVGGQSVACAACGELTAEELRCTPP